MIRNIAGIMADEEPKTPISPSGLYNTSSISNVFADYHYYSDYTLEGLSEFTMMAWVRFTGGSNVMYIDYGFYDKIGSISTGFFSFQGSSGTNRIDFSIPTSAGTSLNVFKINSNLTINTWYHLAVTGSLTDNELKLFKDGQVIATSVMPYSIAQPWNNSGTNRSRTSGAVPFYMSQKNVYNRRLTEAEILEHYVYDDNTMSSGVLGFDAMTIAQKSGLIYSSSFTEDISIAGNEFTDKSDNNITLSPQPTLTGDQIYVYTDASDLPSSEVVSSVDSLTLLNDANYVTGSKSPALTNQSDQTWSMRVMIPNLASKTSHQIFTLNNDAPTARSSVIYVENTGFIVVANHPTVGSNTGLAIINSANAISSGVWYDFTIVFDVTGTNTFSLYVNDSFEISGSANGNVGNSVTYDLGIGTRWSFKTNDMEGYLNNLRIWDKALTPAERAENYNGDAEEYVCYNKLVADTSTLVNGLVFDSSLEDASLVENTGNSTLTASGTPTYTNQGMTKLCNS